MAEQSVARQRQDTPAAEVRLSIVLAYTLMELSRRNPDRFEAIAGMLFDDVPESRTWDGRALLRKHLVVKGGKKGAA